MIKCGMKLLIRSQTSTIQPLKFGDGYVINSSPPSAAYIRQWIESALVQTMAYRLFGAKPLFNQCCVIVIWTLRHKLQWSFNQNTKLFIYKNASENVVCEMVAILSRGDVLKTVSKFYWIRYLCRIEIFPFQYANAIISLKAKSVFGFWTRHFWCFGMLCHDSIIYLWFCITMTS